MDRLRVVRAVTSGPAARVEAWRARATDRIVPGPYAETPDALPSPEALRARVESGGLEALVDAGLEDRILIGSDDMIWPDALGLAVEGVDSAPFSSASQKHKIFHDNATPLLGGEAAPSE